MSSISPLSINECDSRPGLERSPFALANEKEYQTWRKQKLQLRDQHCATKIFRVEADLSIGESMRIEMTTQVQAFNFICFETGTELNRQDFLKLNQGFGLGDPDLNSGAEADEVSLVQMAGASDPRARYIPYTDRALNWPIRVST